jgi:hypothetical protein
MRPSLAACVTVAVLSWFPSARAAEPDAKAAFFTDAVRPILRRCVACHGGAEPTGGLDLTTRANALKGGDSGPALQPNDAPKSLLFGKVSSRKMPPKKPLSDAEVDVLRRWIDDGAVWDGVVRSAERADAADWWSLQKLTRPEPPAVKNKDWVRNPIDAFVLARLEERGLKPTAPADRVTLIRRVTYDLTGLPPTPDEIDAFVKDDAADAYEKVVDRLLASPHYGERWGRHWLDVARFSESDGFERDKLRDHSWRYRDYVVQSFNDDKPYTQFVKEQIAGDVLDPVTPGGIVATGFLTAGPYDEAGNSSVSVLLKARIREEELEEMVGLVGQTFLGTTANCARCHDHKFDPILQKDYYRLKAVFEGVRDGNRAVLTPEQAKERDEKIARLTRRIDDDAKRLAVVEQAGREKVLRDRPPAAADGAPKPLARWSFEADARDAVGELHGALEGGAVVENGRLKLNGTGAFLRTPPLKADVREKTLEAWVSLANLTQRGGGVLSLETKDGRVFDAVVFGEREPGKWIAGSSNFHRTRDLDAAAETAKPGDPVHMAVVYKADDSIAVYRNGAPYAPAYTPTGTDAALRTYAGGDGRVLLGLRHTGAGNGFFAGEVAEARLYDKALSAAEVAASFKAGPVKVSPEELLKALTREQRRERDEAADELARLREELSSLGSPPQAWCAVPASPPPTFVLKRGDVEKSGEQVAAGGLSAVTAPSPDFGLAFDAPEGERRRKFAEWVAGPDNPLTVRVMVNRVWHYHFGRGIAATPNDFGFNGERPTHPELLDWLASEFIAQGWSVKKLHKLIVTSATYQQGSAYDAKAARQDADDRLLWRFAPRRLEAEAVRDAMLAAAGRLNDAVGGPSFRPFTVTVFNSHFYTLTDPDEPEYNRRTIYRINVESAKSPLLEAFDCPEPSTKTPRRGVTTTPLQALGLMNNIFVLRMSRSFADRVTKEAGADPEAQARLAYRLALGRPPTKDEAERTAALVRDHGTETLCWVLFNASEFLYLR